jgi:metallo-beta-lactamase family protein
MEGDKKSSNGKSKATLTFHGGAGSVTGANFLLETHSTHSFDTTQDKSGQAKTQKILIDCGLVQGGAFCDECNWDTFPYDPKKIDALFVTHAHTDHIGRIPRLVASGFRGPIYSTTPTKDIAALMFEDALKVMQDELAKRGNPRAPLYTEHDIVQTLSQWDTFAYHEKINLKDGVTGSFLDAGHILGSAMVAFSRNGKRLVITGDLGNDHVTLTQKTEPITAEYLVMESVYGDRTHEGIETRREVLADAIRHAQKKRGVLLIPAFSLERTQLLLYEISELLSREEVSPIPVFLDAPLAIRLLQVYRTYPAYLNDTVREKMEEKDPFSFPGLVLTPNAKESYAIYSKPNPKIIIAGSGMSHGGRIRGHEQKFLSDPTSTILFAGYQSVGSLGRRLAEGAHKVNIDGTWVRVRATIRELHGYSAHKDRDGLLAFVEHTADTLERVFVAMGEPKSSLFLTQRLRDFLGVDAVVPGAGESFFLDW